MTPPTDSPLAAKKGKGVNDKKKDKDKKDKDRKDQKGKRAEEPTRVRWRGLGPGLRRG